MHKFRNYQKIHYLLLFACLAFIFVLPILLSGKNIGIQDWDQQLAYLESARISVINYGQFPFWNPYHCGGMPNFANPQSNIISITFLLVLLFGTLTGVKISIFIHYVITLLGFFLLSKHFKLTNSSSLVASIIFAFSGVLSSALGVGMLSFIAISYIPFVLLFFLRAIEKKGNIKLNIILSSVFLALCFYTGYQIPMIFLPIFLAWSLLESVRHKNIRPFLLLLLIVGGFLILSSPKLFLSFQLLSSFPRLISDQSGYTLKNLYYFMFYVNQGYINNLPAKNFSYGMDENSLYVGIIPFTLFLSGLFYVIKKQKILIVLLVITFWLMLGNTIKILSLWNFIKIFPFYNSFRVAQRFRFDFLVFFALLSGFGLTFVVSKIPDKFKRIGEVVIILVVFINLFAVSYASFLSKAFIISNPFPSKTNTGFYSVTNYPVNYTYAPSVKMPKSFYYDNTYLPWGSEYTATKNNTGTINCYEPIPVAQNAKGKDDKNYKGEFYLVDNKGKVDIKYWSPNRIVIDVANLSGTDILVINQNYDSHWLVDLKGTMVKSQNYKGLVSFPVNHPQEINFVYNPFYINLK